MFTESAFIAAVEESFRMYKIHGARSTEKLKPLHRHIADILRSIWGNGFDVHYLGTDSKELTIEGKYYPKDIDITVTKNDKPVFCLGVKFVTSNYKQNANNYFENMMGETANIQALGTRTITHRNTMASLAKTYSAEKLNGQVYTPLFVVQKILDDIGYNMPSLLGKRIIDPACGDGRFITEVAKRIIKLSPKKYLKENLEYIYGWDIDPIAVKLCIENLNQLIDFPMNWNIKQTDAIQHHQKKNLFLPDNGTQTFDYIVGNPPYIRIQHLDIKQRQYIQQHYDFCKNGSTDIYIAFYELCLNLLTDNGICGLITPNTFLCTETARAMRQYFSANANLIQITNYGDRQLFNDATTYSAITIFNKGGNPNFKYQKAVSETNYEERVIGFDELKEPFWQLSVTDKLQPAGTKLKDVCKIHVGITTLCDTAYIFPITPINEHGVDEQYVYAETKFCGRIKLERAILKPIIKGSKLKDSTQPITEYVLFPYKKENGKHTIIPEYVLQSDYPFAYAYLLKVKPELDKRDNGKPNPTAWYAFGRSQGLDTSFGAKIIFSPMNIKPNFVYYDNPDCTFYSGYCIKYAGDVSKLLPQLNSEQMQEFVQSSSRDFRGGWKAYNKKVIENFGIRTICRLPAAN